MKILTCPLNGPRNITEFQCRGAVRAMPDPEACDDAAWTDYVWNAENRLGVVREWWCHVPTGTWFIAERDTATDEILRTYFAAELDREAGA